MMQFIIYAMIYLGSALMIYNIWRYAQFAKSLRQNEHWETELIRLYIPVILLILFLIGYLAIGIFGHPDIIVSSILLGGSIFVFFIFLFLKRITGRIKENERLESRLLAAEESSRSKSAFLSSMSHEMRTPMNVIIGLDRMALKEPGLLPQTRDALEKIGASANHLLALINDVLDMNRIEAGRMSLKDEPFSLQEMLSQINVMFRSQCEDKRLVFESRVIGEPENALRGDEVKLKRVLINILGNAVKFTNAPGTITFTTEQTERTEETAVLRFIIRDTGIGMDPEFIPKLFEVFSQEDATTTNRYGGSGLGMSISKSLLDMMNGTIRVRSQKGEGSEFTVTVPLHIADEPVPDTRCTNFGDHTEKSERLNWRILLAEDIDLNAEIMIHLLTSEGITVEHAENGQIALEMFEKSPEFYYTAILMDVRMPVMDGLTAARKIRSLGRADADTVPIIAMTANAFEEDVQLSLEAGMNAHLTKPIDPERLCRTLYEFIRC